MKPIHHNGDNKRLYFTNYERRSDDEEYLEIVSILKKNNYTINRTMIGPDCDLHYCEIGGYSFNIIRSIDGDGTFLYCDDEQGMYKTLDKDRNDHFSQSKHKAQAR